MTYERSQFIDFSAPYLDLGKQNWHNDVDTSGGSFSLLFSFIKRIEGCRYAYQFWLVFIGISILGKKPEQLRPEIMSFMQPFENKLWLCIFAALFGTAIVLHCVGRWGTRFTNNIWEYKFEQWVKSSLVDMLTCIETNSMVLIIFGYFRWQCIHLLVHHAKV